MPPAAPAPPPPLYCRQSAVDGGEAHGRFLDQVVGVPDRGWSNLRFPATRHGVSRCVATIHFSAAAVRSAGYSIRPDSFMCAFRRSGPGIPSEVGHPFQLKPARDSDDPGHLLGLALVSAFSSVHSTGSASSF